MVAAVRICVCVVAAAVADVTRSVADGRVSRTDRHRATVKYDVHVSITDVPAPS